jgi:hypothetical protein
MGCYLKMKLNWSITPGNHAWIRDDRGTGNGPEEEIVRWELDGSVTWSWALYHGVYSHILHIMHLNLSIYLFHALMSF